jgi:hypothetical protein
MQIEALHADKRTLAKLLQQRESDLEDTHNRHKQALVTFLFLTAGVYSV